MTVTLHWQQAIGTVLALCDQHDMEYAGTETCLTALTGAHQANQEPDENLEPSGEAADKPMWAQGLNHNLKLGIARPEDLPARTTPNGVTITVPVQTRLSHLTNQTSLAMATHPQPNFWVEEFFIPASRDPRLRKEFSEKLAKRNGRLAYAGYRRALELFGSEPEMKGRLQATKNRWEKWKSAHPALYRAYRVRAIQDGLDPDTGEVTKDGLYTSNLPQHQVPAPPQKREGSTPQRRRRQRPRQRDTAGRFLGQPNITIDRPNTPGAADPPTKPLRNPDPPSDQFSTPSPHPQLPSTLSQTPQRNPPLGAGPGSTLRPLQVTPSPEVTGSSPAAATTLHCAPASPAQPTEAAFTGVPDGFWWSGTRSAADCIAVGHLLDHSSEIIHGLLKLLGEPTPAHRAANQASQQAQAEALVKILRNVAPAVILRSSTVVTKNPHTATAVPAAPAVPAAADNQAKQPRKRKTPRTNAIDWMPRALRIGPAYRVERWEASTKYYNGFMPMIPYLVTTRQRGRVPDNQELACVYHGFEVIALPTTGHASVMINFINHAQQVAGFAIALSDIIRLMHLPPSMVGRCDVSIRAAPISPELERIAGIAAAATIGGRRLAELPTFVQAAQDLGTGLSATGLPTYPGRSSLGAADQVTVPNETFPPPLATRGAPFAVQGPSGKVKNGPEDLPTTAQWDYPSMAGADWDQLEPRPGPWWTHPAAASTDSDSDFDIESSEGSDAE